MAYILVEKKKTIILKKGQPQKTEAVIISSLTDMELRVPSCIHKNFRSILNSKVLFKS